MEAAMQSMVRLRHPISDDDLDRFSRDNPGWQIERDAAGGLLMSPTSSAGGAKNAKLTFQLVMYADMFGGKSFDSNGGFTLPDGSVLSPDGSWVREDRWASLSKAVQDSYAPIVPDIWIELRSKRDNTRALKIKLQTVKDFGATYVLLIDPYERCTWSLGTAPHGFALDLDAIYDA